MPDDEANAHITRCFTDALASVASWCEAQWRCFVGAAAESPVARRRIAIVHYSRNASVMHPPPRADRAELGASMATWRR